jgi:PRTRC genetic system ThiF family protein
VVEDKNCYRQNFCLAERGRNKARSLAERYGLAWGVEIIAVSEAATRDTLGKIEAGGLTLFVGCVDGPTGRQAIADAVSAQYRGPRWWLDCGNSKSSGQVVIGAGGSPARNPFELSGVCSWLPLPTAWHPDLLKPAAEDQQQVSQVLSCADMAMQDSQGLAINQRVAAEATDYLVRLLLTHDLRKYATYMDLESGTTKARYIVDGMVFPK